MELNILLLTCENNYNKISPICRLRNNLIRCKFCSSLSETPCNKVPTMRIKLKKIQVYLVITIFLNILFPAFIDCYDLTKNSFFLSILIFESPEQETASDGYLDKLVVFETNNLSMIFALGTNLFDPLSNFSFQISSSDQETFPLRC
jgi:hypothetical protein